VSCILIIQEETLVSPETIAPSPVQASLESASQGFDPATFDAAVMTTYGRFPIALVRGQGCRVWDATGREYLDFVAGIATCTLGHAHPALVEAVTAQIATLHHVSNLYYIPDQGELATWLTQHSCADRVFFCNSGAEANEAAIKLVRKYAHEQRGIESPIIITAQASFHGRTLAAITATGQPKYHKGFEPLVSGFHYVPYNDLAALEAAIAQLDQNTPQVAAILLEPLQGEGGVMPGDRAYFQGVRELCDRHNILLVLDEVQVGMGRSGQLWGHETLGIEPDVFTLAKGLAGGIPIGAMLCKTHCDVFQPGDHASTFGGNPLATAAGLAVCRFISQPGFLEQVQTMGAYLREGLVAIAQRFPTQIQQVRGWGLINGLVLQPEAGLSAVDVVKAAMGEGLLLVPAGTQVVRFLPPLIVMRDEIDQALIRVEKALASLIHD
jgi:acetylornithine/N-succinyldiaminopimelate aminotransferase